MSVTHFPSESMTSAIARQMDEAALRRRTMKIRLRSR